MVELLEEDYRRAQERIVSLDSVDEIRKCQGECRAYKSLIQAITVVLPK